MRQRTILLWGLLLCVPAPPVVAAQQPAVPWHVRSLTDAVHLEQEHDFATVARRLAAVRRFDTRAALARRLGRPASVTRQRWIWLAAEPGDAPDDGDLLILHFRAGMPVKIEVIATTRARLVRSVPVE